MTKREAKNVARNELLDAMETVFLAMQDGNSGLADTEENRAMVAHEINRVTHFFRFQVGGE